MANLGIDILSNKLATLFLPVSVKEFVSYFNKKLSSRKEFCVCPFVTITQSDQKTMTLVFFHLPLCLY